MGRMGWNTWKRTYIWGVEMITRVVLTLQVNFKSFHQHRNWWNWIFRLKKTIFSPTTMRICQENEVPGVMMASCWVPAPRSQVEESATRATRSSPFRTRDFTTMRSWGGVDFPVLWQVNFLGSPNGCTMFVLYKILSEELKWWKKN